MDSRLDEDFQREWRAAGYRWSKACAAMPEHYKREFVARNKERREKLAVIQAECETRRRQPEPEDQPIAPSDCGSPTTTNNDCGGGRRVIRGTSSFS